MLALFTAGIAASLRASVANDLQRIFLDPIDKDHSGAMIGAILGVPFLGFAITIAIGSPLLDAIGMGLLLPLSGICFIGGTLIIMFAGSLASGRCVYYVLVRRRGGHGHRLGIGGDGRQSAVRVALSRREDRAAERAARMVAGRIDCGRFAGLRAEPDGSKLGR